MPITAGRPRVLAFIQSWSPELAARELPGIRAQLRGLGAELAVVSDTGAWWLGPDDELEPVSRDEAIGDCTVARTADALFVLDGTNRVRFSHVATGELPATLGEALAAAGEALVSRPTPPITFTRREWALTSLCAGFSLVLFGCKSRPKGTSDRAAAPPPAKQAPAPPTYKITLDINGQPRQLEVEGRVSLLDALRERLGLTGTKKGCDHGQCGACTVHVDGRRVVSCMVLAVMAQGKKITTIEGLAQGDQLHPVQAAFVEHDGFQCGYCTPGQIMSAVALLAEGHAKTEADVREQMSGNLCRCGAYPNIVAAIQAARTKGA